MLDIYARSIEQFGREVAGTYMAGIDRAFDRLADHPEIGPIYPLLRPPIRLLVDRSHHILYDFDGTTVWVARIIHHALDVHSQI